MLMTTKGFLLSITSRSLNIELTGSSIINRGMNRNYRVLVLWEDFIYTVIPDSFHVEETRPKGTYIAIALERYVVAQAETLEELRSGIERLLVSQEYLDKAHNVKPVKPAPEWFQRLRNHGSEVEDPSHLRVTGTKAKILDRWDIDLNKSSWRVVDNA